MQVYLASILLEPDRWKPGRVPSIRASAWSGRAAAAGFDGWELFENHYLLADDAERGALCSGALPIHILNTYASFDATGAPARGAATRAALELGASGVKFNVENDPERFAEHRSAIVETNRTLDGRARLLCECHPGTWFEEPARVRAFCAGMQTWPFDVIVHPFLLLPEEIVSRSQLFGRHMRHAHVQMRALGDATRFLALEQDAPRARECLAALEATGFAGSFTIEFAAPTCTACDTPEHLFAAACRDQEFLRTHWGGSD